MATLYYDVCLKRVAKGGVRLKWTNEERDQLRRCKEYTNEPRYYTNADAEKFFARLPADLRAKCEIGEFCFA